MDLMSFGISDTTIMPRNFFGYIQAFDTVSGTQNDQTGTAKLLSPSGIVYLSDCLIYSEFYLILTRIPQEAVWGFLLTTSYDIFIGTFHWWYGNYD